MSPRILIVGAGPTGLTAAVELARRGILPEVVEKRPGPSELSRAVGILPSSIEIFRRSGTDVPVLDEAVRFEGGVFHDGARPVLHLPLNIDARTRIWGLAQDRTERHLVATLERLGGSVRYGAILEQLREAEDAVEVTLGGVDARYDLVIGADGVHSAVRKALGFDFPGHDLPEEWSIADVDAPDWNGRGRFMGYRLAGGKVAVVVPLETARFRIIASAPDALAALPVPMPVATVRRSGAFTISVRQVARYQTARVFLAGDAAHCHSPVGGRGMNLGISDAAELAERIAEGTTAGYTGARHAAGAHVIRLSERGRRFIQAKGPVARAGVLAAMRTVDAVPALRRAVARQLVSG